jgi:hypothetical protein
MKEHAELLSSVRDDISEYKVSMAVHFIVIIFLMICCFVSQSKVCFALFHAGLWEYVPTDAVTTGESSYPWKYSSCKLNWYSVVLLQVICFRKKISLYASLPHIFLFHMM